MHVNVLYEFMKIMTSATLYVYYDSIKMHVYLYKL